MGWKFNPFTATFDQVGAGSGGGGGAQYIDGEVTTFADLPLDGTAALNTAWLVRGASGVWPVSRKQAGIYIRTATGGTDRSADYTYAGTMPDVFSDVNFTVYDDADPTKAVQINATGITAGTTRTLTVPDASGTIALVATTATATHNHSHNALSGLQGGGSGDYYHLPAGTADGQVPTWNNTTGEYAAAAPAAGGITAIGATAADVLSVSGSDLVADDGGTINGFNPAVHWDDANGKLIYANPLTRSGAFHVGVAPTTTALGSNSVTIVSEQSNANQVASGASSVAIGPRTRASNNGAVAVGYGNTASGEYSTIIGNFSTSSGSTSISIGRVAQGTGEDSVAIGRDNTASAVGATVCGGSGLTANLRGMFLTVPFRSIYWGGSTTDATANVVLNLDATATNRFTIAANTMVVADVLVAANSTAGGKSSFWHYHVAIRRDGSNNTVLVGSPEQIGTTQTYGSPSGWAATLSADDTNEALQLAVTGEAATTIAWRAVAFYRVA